VVKVVVSKITGYHQVRVAGFYKHLNQKMLLIKITNYTIYSGFEVKEAGTGTLVVGGLGRYADRTACIRTN
jgi:hypothetical protein